MTTEAPDSDDPEDPTRQERLRELARDMRRRPAESERIQRRLEELRDRRRREQERSEG
jgi:hypothetical protein